MTQAFTFGWQMDNHGTPIAGNVSDERPLIVGLTTKALMLRMTAPPRQFYPTPVCDLQTESMRVPRTRRGAFRAIAEISLGSSIHYLPGDTSDISCCSTLPTTSPLLGHPDAFGSFFVYFFHTMKKIQVAIKPLTSGAQGTILREIYDLHFTGTEAVHLELRNIIAFLTPSGFATTNNPAEAFNALLKRDYTLRHRLKMDSLLRELSACCMDQSSRVRAFAFGVCPTATLLRRVSGLTRARLLSPAEGRTVDAPNKRSKEETAVSAQMGANYARMEVEEQTWAGWAVDVERQWCLCSYWFVFGSCIHALFALHATAHVDSSGRYIPVSRRKRRRSGLAVINNVGRPRSNGPGLSYE
ncbi:hypothetical protein PC119_g12563 [Phytophthora cactorum]|nr:hypothetical protein PC114_g13679 [Phytophthora cactorum]KAG3013296.1 hypothetical protein PC119_g12563 [Phytophthora cactorum]KAG3158224.1 hypothetical protein C6341_g14469 [Phytophthora cactorum]